jgi:hypothetical protein
LKTREENGPFLFHLPGAMATFGGNKKRAQASTIPGAQKRIKICVYDTPPQVLCPTTGRELLCLRALLCWRLPQVLPDG